MRYQPEVSIQNLKQERTKKQRNRYSEALSLINNQGTFHLLQNGDILTCYEQYSLNKIDFFVRPQAHGIHPPRKLIFFSKRVIDSINRVWRASRFYWKKTRRLSVKKRKEDRSTLLLSPPEKRQESYEPTPLINKTYVTNARRQWERVSDYYREAEKYESAGSLLK